MFQPTGPYSLEQHDVSVCECICVCVCVHVCVYVGVRVCTHGWVVGGWVAVHPYVWTDVVAWQAFAKLSEAVQM